MNDIQVEDWRRTVEKCLFSSGSVAAAVRIDAQHAFAQLMQTIEDMEQTSAYSMGYKAGWNDALQEAGKEIAAMRRK